MANKTKGFVVASGRRPSGVPFWTVRGSIGGKQLRKEFSDRTEALSFQEQKNSELFGGRTVDQITAVTRLTPERLREAEIAIAQLEHEFPGTNLHDVVDYYRSAAPELPVKDVQRFAQTFTALRGKYPDANLADVCDFFLSSFRPSTSITLGDAMDNYVADVMRRHETGSLSWWQMRSIRFATQKFERHFGSAVQLAHITTTQLNEFLHETSRGKDGSGNYSNKTWTNRRGYLTRFFSFCVEQGWLESNPASGVRKYTKREHNKPSPQIMSAERVRLMMLDAEAYAGGRLVPYLVFTTFCGIRPAWIESEMTRLKAEQVDLRRRELRLPGPQSKTRKPRVVRLQPNVAEWLKAYPLNRYPIIPRNFRKNIIAFRARHQIGHDVLRHTYASMLVGKCRSVGDAALQAGNTESVMWGSYLSLVDEAEAARFWKIRPQSSDANGVRSLEG